MGDEMKRNLRIGALTLVALAVLGVVIFTIGQRSHLFIHHISYYAVFRNVTGLQVGAPVTLHGVDVGFVQRIELPGNPDEEGVKVWFTVNETYADRIRTDSEATIRTMGLLGDRYLEIRGGSSSAALIPEHGEVRGINQPELEEFMSGGEDVMENVLSISSSLRVILRRVEQGEGLLGQMTMGPVGGEEGISHLTRDTLTSLDEILERVRAGKGLLGRLLYDDAFARDVEAAMRSLRAASGSLADDLGRDDSAYAVLMRNPDTARLLQQSVTALHDGSQALAAAMEELASGEGTLPRLLSDREYADHFLDDLLALVANLRSIATKLDEGQGSLGELINDPRLYEDLEHVVRGVEHSKVVSWFVRNRRRAGEKLEHEEEQGAEGPSTP